MIGFLPVGSGRKNLKLAVPVSSALSDLASTLIYPELNADARETLRTLAFSEKQIATTDGLWFTVRIMPYRTLANVIQGVVITFVDITAAKELESRLRKAQDRDRPPQSEQLK